MKRLKYLLIAGVSLLLTSCENFLDRQPESSLSGETFWTSEQDLKTWNAGMYDGLQSTLRTNWFYWGELRSGVYAERGTAYDRNLLYNGLNSQSGSSSWSDLYKTIYRANAAIKHIPHQPYRQFCICSIFRSGLCNACIDVFLCYTCMGRCT